MSHTLTFSTAALVLVTAILTVPAEAAVRT